MDLLLQLRALGFLGPMYFKADRETYRKQSNAQRPSAPCTCTCAMA